MTVEHLSHHRAGADGPVAPGVYRVVGSDDDAVTLLRVAEGGRRVHSGEVVRVPREAFEALEPAGNPDAGLGRLRQVPRNVAAHPLVGGGALLLVAVGGYLWIEGVDAAAFVAASGLAVLWILVK